MMIVIITVIGVILYQSSNHVALATEMGDGYGPETVTNFAGYMHVHNNTRHLWYWFFESRNAPSTDPFVLWMTGGPGCSSLVALFNENGPYIIQDDLSLKLNPYSWNTRTNILFIDQPVNTGFSYSDFGDIGVVSEAEMAQDMWEFFQHFFQQYPKYAKLPFYITGESYAGHYIPALAHRIYEQNNKHVGLPINLKGIAIGNGLVDPITQFPQYAPYAYQHNVTTKTQFELMEALIPECVALIAACSQNSTLGWLACINAYVMCSYAELIPVQFTGINVYDVREPCRVAPLCYNFTLTEKLLAMPSVRQALNVGSRKWVDCNRLVDLELVFAGDWMVSMATAIPDLLASSIDVLVYSGEYDFICNWYGGQAWTNALKWPGQGSFNKAMNTTWHVNGNVAGSSKAYQGFTFLRVANAGHMVPLNQPVNALSMLQTFIDRKPFN